MVSKRTCTKEVNKLARETLFYAVSGTDAKQAAKRGVGGDAILASTVIS